MWLLCQLDFKDKVNQESDHHQNSPFASAALMGDFILLPRFSGTLGHSQHYQKGSLSLVPILKICKGRPVLILQSRGGLLFLLAT